MTHPFIQNNVPDAAEVDCTPRNVVQNTSWGANQEVLPDKHEYPENRSNTKEYDKRKSKNKK